jgi:hypothetical protein
MIRIEQINKDQPSWKRDFPPDVYQFVAWEFVDDEKADSKMLDILFPTAIHAFLTTGTAGEFGVPEVDAMAELRVLWFNVYAD